jgi:hypothetical protein
MGNQGAGGYGGISTMNQDQRKGVYWPHKGPFSRYVTTELVYTKCLKCRKEWKHHRIEPSCPPVCGAGERSEPGEGEVTP